MPAMTRLTVHPGEDVLLPAGMPLDALRGPLADLLRRPELRHARLRADGVDLAAGSRVGERPLLPGSTVRVDVGTGTAGGGTTGAGDGTQRTDAEVLGSAWVVARTTGARAGELYPLGVRTPLAIPGGPRVRVSRRGRVRVVSLRLRDRVRFPWGRRWRPGTQIDAGGRYLLVPSGDAGTLLTGVADTPGGIGWATAANTTAGSPPTLTLAATLLPAVGAVVLAVVLHQPTFALFAVAGLLGAVPQVVAAVRRRRAGLDAEGAAQPPGAARPGGTGTQRGDAGRPGAGMAAPGGVATPDVLARVTLAALNASEATWHDVVRPRPAPVPASAASGFPGAHLPDGALAVRGPRALVLAAARAVVAGLVVRGGSVQVEGAGADHWGWCRWLGGEPSVFVVDPGGAQALGAGLFASAGAAHRSGGDVVLCLPSGAVPPAWCRAVLDVGVLGSGATSSDTVVRSTQPGGGSRTGALVGVSASWAERFARQLAAVRALGREVGALWAGPGREDPAAAGVDPDGADPADPRLPAVVSLTSLLATPGPVGWAVPLGVGVDGRTVAFNLVEDGPHLLVAGTTGAGKSELLQALVLALTLRRTPTELALALIDFKGGASFGPCAGLPHVVGQVNDLDVGLAARALDGLRAELRRRKAVLAEHGVADMVALPPGTLPRLVVVVDEFRALADDLPELLPGLLRVAAQGRSLGVHLILATQRPAGAVSADVRANVSARLALRVVDAADSHDVLDSAAAAHIPAGVPGRAVLRVGAAEPVALQCAYAGAPPTSPAAALVRRAPAWPERADPVQQTTGGAGTGVAVVAGLVETARAVAQADPAPPWPAPWLPPLPATVPFADVRATEMQAAHVGHAAPSGPRGPGRPGLLLALGDAPTVPARVPIAWNPAHGHLAILGRARSGRSTALLTLAHAALERGWHVHALVPPTAVTHLAPLAAHPCFGTLTGSGDPRRTIRLLRLLRQRAAGSPPVLVLVDDVDELRAALATPTTDPLAAALADSGWADTGWADTGWLDGGSAGGGSAGGGPAGGGRPGGAVAFAVTSASAGIGGLASRFGPRLVLTGTDATADAMLGAPSPFAGRGRTPGRGVWLGGLEPLECQVALPAGDAGRGAAGDHPPVRVLPLPRTVDLPALRRDAPQAIGVGGDSAVPLGLTAPRGALVVGPRGSGRTTALRLLLGALTAPTGPSDTEPSSTAPPPVVIARDRALLAEAARCGALVELPTPTALRALLARWEHEAPRSPAPVLVVDDADALAQSAPLETEQLAELAADGAVTVLAAATTLTAAMAQRGLLAQLRTTRTGLVLSPTERGAQDVFGVQLDDAADPGAPRLGRAALVVDGAVTALQLASPSSSPEGATPPARGATPPAQGATR